LCGGGADHALLIAEIKDNAQVVFRVLEDIARQDFDNDKVVLGEDDEDKFY
jgi:hypothetical protein